MKPKGKLYTIIHVNCICGAYDEARLGIAFRHGPRCRTCHRICYQWLKEDTVIARNEVEAMAIWRQICDKKSEDRTKLREGARCSLK